MCSVRVRILLFMKMNRKYVCWTFFLGGFGTGNLPKPSVCCRGCLAGALGILENKKVLACCVFNVDLLSPGQLFIVMCHHFIC